jgi:hypothetical protein
MKKVEEHKRGRLEKTPGVMKEFSNIYKEYKKDIKKEYAMMKEDGK